MKYPLTLLWITAALSQSLVGKAETLDVTGSYAYTDRGYELVGYVQPNPNTTSLRLVFRDIWTGTLGSNLVISGLDPIFRTPNPNYNGKVKEAEEKIEFGFPAGVVTLIPNRALEGDWMFFNSGNQTYLPCRITRKFNRLTFFNEHGGSASGRVEASGALRAEQWSLDGQADNEATIRWANGSVWEKVPEVAGTYFEGVQRVTQNGRTLNFTNEFGGSSAGVVLSPTLVQATDWGNLKGTLLKDGSGRVLGIDWANGSKWRRLPSQLAGNYDFISPTSVRVNGPTIKMNGRALTICNENGGCSSGDFFTVDEIRAIDWGNLRGALLKDAAGTIHEIQWSNQTVWKKRILRPN